MFLPKQRSKKRAVHEASVETVDEAPPDLNSMIYCSFIGTDATRSATTSSLLELECPNDTISGSHTRGSAAGAAALPAERADSDEKEGREVEDEDDEMDLSFSDAQRYHLQCLGVGIGLLALAVLRKRYLRSQ